MEPKKIHAVLKVDEDIPERMYVLKSGFDEQFIVVYEDPVDLTVHYMLEENIPKGVIDLLKKDGD